MNTLDFEGSIILEKLAALGLQDDFFAAVDSDDLDTVSTMLEEAGIDEETIQTVLNMISEGI